MSFRFVNVVKNQGGCSFESVDYACERHDDNGSFRLLGSSSDSEALLLCFAAWRIRLWHAAVRCHSDAYSDPYSDAYSDAYSGTYSEAYSDESFVTYSAQRIGVIIIYIGLYQGLPSLCSSLPLHRVRFPRFRD